MLTLPQGMLRTFFAIEVLANPFNLHSGRSRGRPGASSGGALFPNHPSSEGANNRRAIGARDRVTLSQGDVFSAGEVGSAYDHALMPYQGERLFLGAENSIPRNVR